MKTTTNPYAPGSTEWHVFEDHGQTKETGLASEEAKKRRSDRRNKADDRGSKEQRSEDAKSKTDPK